MIKKKKKKKKKKKILLKDFIIKIPTEGMPTKNGGFGDLYIEIVVLYPERLTDAQEKGNIII